MTSDAQWANENFSTIDKNKFDSSQWNLPRTGFSGQVPGKVILTGEHAVVYGAHALATPLSTKSLSLDMQIHGSGTSISMNDKNVTSSLLEVIRQGFKLLQLTPQPLLIKGQSDITIGAGLGSSAAFCVSIVRAMANLFGITLLPAEMAKTAGSLESFFHGKPSGLDTAVVAFAKAILFRRGYDPIAVDLNHLAPQIDDATFRWPFILIDSMMRSSTKVMIHTAAPAFQGSSGERMIAKFDETTKDLVKNLSGGHWQSVGEIFQQAGALLKEIGVVNDCLSHIMQELKQIGALASKPTGAGGGGYILAMLHPHNYREQLQKVLAIFGQERVIEVNA